MVGISALPRCSCSNWDWMEEKQVIGLMVILVRCGQYYVDCSVTQGDRNSCRGWQCDDRDNYILKAFSLRITVVMALRHIMTSHPLLSHQQTEVINARHMLVPLCHQ